MRALFAASLPENPWLLTVQLVCIAIFIAVVGWQLLPARRQEQDEASRLPLND